MGEPNVSVAGYCNEQARNPLRERRAFERLNTLSGIVMNVTRHGHRAPRRSHIGHGVFAQEASPAPWNVRVWLFVR